VYEVATPTAPQGKPAMIEAMVSGPPNIPILNISFVRPCVMNSHPVVFEIGWISAATPRIANNFPTSRHWGPRTIATIQSEVAIIKATPGMVSRAIFSSMRK